MDKLKHLASKKNDGTIDIEDFGFQPDLSKWMLETLSADKGYSQVLAGMKAPWIVNVEQLIPTQKYVQVAKVAKLISTWPTWSDKRLVVTRTKDGPYWLQDGHHRFAASILLDQKTVQIQEIIVDENPQGSEYGYVFCPLEDEKL